MKTNSPLPQFLNPGLCIRSRFSLSRRMSGRTVSAQKSGFLETEAFRTYGMVNLPAGKGGIENSNVVTDFEEITGRNRVANTIRVQRK